MLFAAAALTMPMPAYAAEKPADKAADQQEKEADDDKSVKVKLEDLPEAVRKTLKREAGDGKIKEIEKETDDGRTVYEAEVIIDGSKYEIEIAENGKLISKKLDDDEDDDDKGARNAM
jgi:uncharacterized membrane protein YkoI